MPPTINEVAEWMLQEIQRDQFLYQETAALEIESNFGEDFIYYNNNGNIAISKDVLKAFRKLTENSVVWERGSRMWRPREQGDEPGRRQF